MSCPDPKTKTNDNKLSKIKMFLWCLQVKRECQEVVKREGIDKLTIEDLVQVTTESCLQPTHLKSCLKKPPTKVGKNCLLFFLLQILTQIFRTIL